MRFFRHRDAAPHPDRPDRSRPAPEAGIPEEITMETRAIVDIGYEEVDGTTWVQLDAAPGRGWVKRFQLGDQHPGAPLPGHGPIAVRISGPFLRTRLEGCDELETFAVLAALVTAANDPAGHRHPSQH